MGRTVPTFTQALEQLRAGWAPFRRALRQEDQAHFDRLFEHARHQGAACAQAARPLPLESLLVAVLVAHEREVAGLRSRLAALEARVAALLEERPAPPEAGATRAGLAL